VKKIIAITGLYLLGTALLGGGCSAGDCSEQSCADFGGDASKTFTSCFSSGAGSSKDEFWLQDSAGNEFYRCERAADDNDSCGVELIGAKESYCAGM
jgi:hypothetical protein